MIISSPKISISLEPSTDYERTPLRTAVPPRRHTQISRRVAPRSIDKRSDDEDDVPRAIGAGVVAMIIFIGKSVLRWTELHAILTCVLLSAIVCSCVVRIRSGRRRRSRKSAQIRLASHSRRRPLSSFLSGRPFHPQSQTRPFTPGQDRERVESLDTLTYTEQRQNSDDSGMDS